MSADDEVLREATSLASELSNGLVTLERSPDDASVAELFRAAHSLKSVCGMAGMDGAAALAHAIEDFLAAVRAGDVDPAGSLVDGVLDAVDDIQAALDAVEEGGTPGGSPDRTAAALRDRIEEQREMDTGALSPDTGATGTADIDLEVPASDGDLSVEEALERASVFDDLDSLAASMDDDGFPDLEGAGSFDAIEWDESSSPAPDRETSPRPDRRGPAPDSEEPTPETDLDATADDPFTRVQDETPEETDIEDLDADIAGESFGEFDDEDDVSIRELVELDPDEDAETDTQTQTETDTQTKVDTQTQTETASAADGTDPAGNTDTVETTATDAAENSAPEAGSDAAADDPFIWVGDLRSEETDIDTLDAAIAAESFGEFDDEDDVSIRELVEMDPNEDDGSETAGESSVNDTTASTEPSQSAGEDTETQDTSRPANVDDLEIDVSAEATPAPSAGPEDVPDEDVEDVLESIDLDEPEPPTGAHEVDFERESGTEAFADRFQELFDVDSDGEATTQSAGTIEESTLDADRFRPEPPVNSDSGGASIHSISVDVETSEDLLNLVGELSMTRLSFEEWLGDTAVEEAEDALGALQSIEAEFRRSVTELRLMPLSPAVDGLPRVGRDIAREQGKRLSVDVEGEDVKLDRSVVERIGDPLVHLVRNAADHGIEPPEEREAAGKPAEGRIELRAERVRDGAVVEVEDDGRGIDPDAVLETAVADDVVTRSEAETMDDEDAYDLLFHHGLTTSEEVTDVSGRGVGMDIVSRTCADLDGSIEVESEPGEGTTVRLRLPVTVAMAKLLFVEVGGEQFAIPTSDVEYVGAYGIDSAVNDGAFVPDPSPDRDDAPSDEDDQYRLLRLHNAFDAPAPSTDEGALVWLRPENGRIALYCDAVVESREAVVKPYGPPLDHVSGISGATLREDGDVVNIIDVTTIA